MISLEYISRTASAKVFRNNISLSLTASERQEDDLEYIAVNKPDYYYSNIDEREASEYNDLYYKEINELLIQAKEDNRTEKQLLSWELYALNLIKESGLPVAVKAEELLRLNNQAISEHKVEAPMVNGVSSSNPTFVYNMGIMPNPAMYQTNVLINMPSNTSGALLKLYDSFNTLFLLEEHNLEPGDNAITIDVSTYSSGLYTFVVEVEGQVVTSKHLAVIH